MKILIALVILLGVVTSAYAEYRYVNDYYRGDGTRVSGYWRDSSNDGNSYNNANYIGLNERRRPLGIY